MVIVKPKPSDRRNPSQRGQSVSYATNGRVHHRVYYRDWIFSFVSGVINATSERIALGIAAGLAFGLAGGIASGIGASVTFRVALGIIALMFPDTLPDSMALLFAMLLGSGVAIGIRVGVGAEVYVGTGFKIAFWIGLVYAALRAYYYLLHFYLLLLLRLRYIAPTAADYRWHPVALDDTCTLPFIGLNRFLLALWDIDPIVAEKEIERLISSYPSERVDALKARIAATARAAAKVDLGRIDDIVNELPEGRGFLEKASRVRAIVAGIAETLLLQENGLCHHQRVGTELCPSQRQCRAFTDLVMRRQRSAEHTDKLAMPAEDVNAHALGCAPGDGVDGNVTAASQQHHCAQTMDDFREVTLHTRIEAYQFSIPDFQRTAVAAKNIDGTARIGLAPPVKLGAMVLIGRIT